MAKLKLNPSPTFKSSVGIPVAGSDPVNVDLTFKHRTRDELDEFVKTRSEKSDTDSVLDMVEGWDLSDEFNRESVDTLIQNYIGSPLAIYRTYIEELSGAKTKN